MGWLAACHNLAPVEVLASTFPGVVLGPHHEEVVGRLCQPRLFGWIPLKPSYGYLELIRAAGGSPERPLFGVTIDAERTFWVFGVTGCHRLHAWVNVAAPEAAAAAAAEAEVDATPRDLLVPDGVDQTTREFFVLYSILQTLGRRWPDDATPKPTEIFDAVTMADARKTAPVLELLPKR